MAPKACTSRGVARHAPTKLGTYHRCRELAAPLGLHPTQYPESESFRFGAGPVVTSSDAALILVAFSGHCSALRVSILPLQLPVLPSHTMMESLDMWYGARSQEVYVGAFNLHVCLAQPSS